MLLADADPAASLNHTILSKAAGAVRLKSDDQEGLRHVYASWPMQAAHLAPGVEIRQAIVEVHSNLAAAHQELSFQLLAARADADCALPEIGPLVARNPRTGLPAVGACKITHERAVDEATLRKRKDWRGASTELDPLCRRFLGDPKGLNFALETDDLAGVEADRSYVAVIHADGNEIGSTFSQLARDQAPEGIVATLSEDLRESRKRRLRRRAKKSSSPRPGTG